MCEDENLVNNEQHESPIHEQPEINIEKGDIDEGLNREAPQPDAWEPTRDETDPNPPGVGNSENE